MKHIIVKPTRNPNLQLLKSYAYKHPILTDEPQNRVFFTD